MSESGKVYVMSDIHGDYGGFIEILHKIDLKECDELYILGDIIDRGPNGIEIIEYIMNKNNIKVTLGNHEKLMIDSIDENGKIINEYWAEIWANPVNECALTYHQFLRRNLEERIAILDYLKALPRKIVLNVNDIKYELVHAKLYIADKEQDEKVDYANQVDYSLYDLWSKMEKDEKFDTDGVIVFGHVPVMKYGIRPPKITRFNENTPKIAIDCGNGYTNKGGRLGCLCLSDNSEYYV